MSYAAGTSVGEDRSRAEVQYLLEKFGADQFGYASDRAAGSARILFRYKGANFVFNLPLAKADDKRIGLPVLRHQRRDHQADRQRRACRDRKAVGQGASGINHGEKHAGT